MRHYLPRKNTDPALPVLCSQSHCQEVGGEGGGGDKNV